MQRRGFLAATAAVGTAGLSGCLDVFRYDDPSGGPNPALESDRPATNETFVAGPMEPYCDRNGGDYPPMSIQEYFADSLPDDRKVDTVETFVSERLPGSPPVTLRPDRPRRLGWRGRRYDIANRFGSERYFVGRVGGEGSNRTVLVVLLESYVEIRVYETAPSC